MTTLRQPFLLLEAEEWPLTGEEGFSDEEETEEFASRPCFGGGWSCWRSSLDDDDDENDDDGDRSAERVE